MYRITSDGLADIQNLVARYFITTDNADADGFVQSWVEPTAFGGYDSGAFGTMHTWQVMHDFEKEHVGPGWMANGKRHLSLNIVIEPVSDDQVHVTNDMVMLEVGGIPRVLATGRYNRSVVVKTAAGWHFKRRTLDIESGFFKAMAAQQTAAGGQ